MSRDPAQGVINWFAWLMVAMFLCSAAGVCLGVWGVWVLLHRWLA